MTRRAAPAPPNLKFRRAAPRRRQQIRSDFEPCISGQKRRRIAPKPAIAPTPAIMIAITPKPAVSDPPRRVMARGPYAKRTGHKGPKGPSRPETLKMTMTCSICDRDIPFWYTKVEWSANQDEIIMRSRRFLIFNNEFQFVVDFTYRL